MNIVFIILESIILSLTLSLDAFIASFAYGSNKIKIPFYSVMVINVVCSMILGISLFLGALIRPYLSDNISTGICFFILLIIGIIKLLDNVTKSIIRKFGEFSKKIHFSFLNFKFVLNVYANPEKADVDSSKTISVLEAISLAFALSLDGMAIGFGSALGDVNGLAVFIASLFTDALAIFLGIYIGNKLADKFHFNIAWISGVILIVMAFLKL